MDGKRRKEGVNLVIPFVPSADNSNLSADGDDSFISVDSAMPSPFSEVRLLLDAFITAVGLYPNLVTGTCCWSAFASRFPLPCRKEFYMGFIQSKANEDRLALKPK